jgi:hypothetical protein
MTCAVRCGWCRFCVCGSVRLWELARSTRLRLCGMYVFYSSKAGCVVVARQIRQQCGGGVVVVVERHLRRLRLAGIHVGVGVSVGVSRHRLVLLRALAAAAAAAAAVALRFGRPFAAASSLDLFFAFAGAPACAASTWRGVTTTLASCPW